MEVEIETGIPLPGAAVKWPFNKLAIGQSFVMPKKQSNAAAYARAVAQRSGLKFKTSAKGLPEGHTRIWRVA